MSEPGGRRRRVALNLGANVAAQGLNFAFPLFAYAYAQRTLGTAALGHALFAITLVDWTSPLIEGGTASYGQIEVGRERDNPARMRSLIGDLVALRAVNAVVAALGLLLAISWPYSDYRGTSLAIAFMLVTSVLDLTYVQTGTQRVWALSALNAASKLVILALLYVLVHEPEDATRFAVLLVASNSLLSIGTYVAATRRWRPSWPTRARLAAAYRAVGPFALMVVFFYGLGKIDFMVVEAYGDPVAVGLYGGISKAYLAIQALVPAMAVAFGSEMLSLRGDPAFARQAHLAFAALALVVLPICVGAWFAGSELLGWLLDPSYHAVAGPFALMCASVVPYAIFVVLGVQTLLTCGEVWRVNLAMGLGVAAGVGSALALVPEHGAWGGAASVLISKTVVAVALAPAALKIVHTRGILKLTWPSAVAAALMGLGLWYFEPRGLWMTVAVGGLIYGAAALPLNARWLLPMVARKIKERRGR